MRYHSVIASRLAFRRSTDISAAPQIFHSQASICSTILGLLTARSLDRLPTIRSAVLAANAAVASWFVQVFHGLSSRQGPDTTAIELYLISMWSYDLVAHYLAML